MCCGQRVEVELEEAMIGIQNEKNFSAFGIRRRLKPQVMEYC